MIFALVKLQFANPYRAIVMTYPELTIEFFVAQSGRRVLYSRRKSCYVSAWPIRVEVLIISFANHHYYFAWVTWFLPNDYDRDLFPICDVLFPSSHSWLTLPVNFTRSFKIRNFHGISSRLYQILI